MKNSHFWGLSVEAPWPANYPTGRLLEEEQRHLTLAFLGTAKLPDLSSLPLPPFSLGQVARADELAFLPPGTPRACAYHLKWLSGEEEITHYRSKLYDWLLSLGYSLDKRPFHPHVTIARSPFTQEQWQEHFLPLPLITTGLHLYESVGDLRYIPLHSIPFVRPFEEIEHTADRAFVVRGKDFGQLLVHAAAAISFEFPPLIDYVTGANASSLQEVVRSLNQMIALCDCDQGCPLKAVSYHGSLQEKHNWLQWEMVIDV